MNTIKFTAVAHSDKGKIRANNEDNFYFNGIHLNAENRDERNYFSDNPAGADLIYGVFDGMGGEALGEEASLIVAETVKKYHNRINKHQSANDDNTFLRVVEEANSRICDKMVETGERRIGTTFAAISIKDDKAKVYNVGDSRVYLFRNNKLKQISVDDTTAQRLINMGVLTKEKAKTHEDRHKLTQHLGIYKDEMIVEPHISNEIVIKKGDCFLLCSDGLTDMVEDEKISEIIKKSKNCKIAARKLVEEALANGGRDNVTVVMISANSSSTVKATGNNKKKIVLPCIIAAVVIAMAAVAVGVLNSGDKAPTEVQDIVATDLKWANPTEEVTVGSSGTLMMQKEPANANGDIIWSTSNDKVMTVNDKGFYTALSIGDVEITAQLDDIKCSMKISVVEAIEDIVVTKSMKLKVGEKAKISYTVVPKTSTQKIVFMTDDESIVSVDETGNVVAHKEGRATINISSGQINKIVVVDVIKEVKDTNAKDNKETEDKGKTPPKKETTEQNNNGNGEPKETKENIEPNKPEVSNPAADSKPEGNNKPDSSNPEDIVNMLQ